jgi:mRNA-degrading endonuclease RelE of RelBE toxin-antitoxin system
MPRSIVFASRFPRTWKRLTNSQRERIFDIIIALPDLLKNPHQHTDYGIRRLHGTSMYEARLDLRWRLIFSVGENEISLFDVLNHDQVKRL